ncbi:MAG: outer membrane protein [Lentisphaeria bacterium]|jgi:outer membrane protein
MYNKIVRTLATLAFSLGACSALHAETLNEIYQHALQNDHEFKAAQAAYEAGLQSKNIGRSGLLPLVTGQYQWADSETDRSGIEDTFIEDPLDEDAEIFAPDHPLNTSLTNTNSGYSLSLTQPLFDMAAWQSYKQGKLSAKSAEAEFQAAKQSLVIRTAEAYFNALRAADNLSTAVAEENALAHELKRTKKRFEVGLTAITEVHEAQASYDSALAQRLQNEGNLGINFEALEVVTGRSYAALSPLKKDFPVLPPSPIDRQEWVDFAVSNNFDLATSSLAAERARRRAKELKAGHYPRVTGSANYSKFNDDGAANGFNSDIDTEVQSFGITVTVPIFSGGGVSASRKQAAYQYLQAKENYNRAQRDTVQGARSLHLTVMTDVATIKARKQATVSNKSALEATQAGYDVGTRDLVDVLNAQRRLYAAQRDYLNSLYTYILNTLRLKEVAGILTPQDIEKLDAWLDESALVSRNI